eukprot:TRINITY_DN15598_c0_g1_i1.p1 TRINITY_DN15598_c0_g1~~TRINITY_DN15598_c0_g1_i1.p1  ORF type:complete len:1134 (+),score=325.00 TRINITY_DN15598_c0_g1_i1:36-3404(+)
MEVPDSIQQLRRNLFDSIPEAPTAASTVVPPLFDKAREPINVYLRQRPALTEEEKRQKPTIQILSDEVVCLRAPYVQRNSERDIETRYKFSKVFDPTTSQTNVFDSTAKQLVNELFEGKNGLFFAHGITNSGKTYTIQGTPENPGVLPRALDAIFDMMTIAHSVQVSFMEIYNEFIYDLLVDPPVEEQEFPLHPGPPPKRTVLKMKEDKHGRVFVKDLSDVEVTSSKTAQEVVARGVRNRQMADTKVHVASSRSHSVFTITLSKWEHGMRKECSKLSIVDLAGSERSNKTAHTGQRMKESCNINSSLMVLQRCMETLRWNQQNPFKAPRIVPFRDSKLTRLFNDSLCDGRAIMIANVNTAQNYYEETFHSLQFTSIARQVTTVSTKEAAQTPGRFNTYRQTFDGTAGPMEGMCGEKCANEKADLMARISVLEDELVGAQARAASLETDIRAEVVQESEEQMEQIRLETEQRLATDRLMLQDTFDRKLALLARNSGAVADEIAARLGAHREEMAAQEQRLKQEAADNVKALCDKANAIVLAEEKTKRDALSVQLAETTAIVNDMVQMRLVRDSEHEHTVKAWKTKFEQANKLSTELSQKLEVNKHYSTKQLEESSNALKVQYEEKIEYVTKQLKGEQAETQRLKELANELQQRISSLEAQLKSTHVGSAILHVEGSTAGMARVLPKESKIVRTPSKKLLLRSDNTPRFKRMDVVDVSPAKEDATPARVTLWKAEVEQSVTGQGINAVFKDIEVLTQHGNQDVTLKEITIAASNKRAAEAEADAASKKLCLSYPALETVSPRAIATPADMITSTAAPSSLMTPIATSVSIAPIAAAVSTPAPASAVAACRRMTIAEFAEETITVQQPVLSPRVTVTNVIKVSSIDTAADGKLVLSPRLTTAAWTAPASETPAAAVAEVKFAPVEETVVEMMPSDTTAEVPAKTARRKRRSEEAAAEAPAPVVRPGRVSRAKRSKGDTENVEEAAPAAAAKTARKSTVRVAKSEPAKPKGRGRKTSAASAAEHTPIAESQAPTPAELPKTPVPMTEKENTPQKTEQKPAAAAEQLPRRRKLFTNKFADGDTFSPLGDAPMVLKQTPVARRTRSRGDGLALSDLLPAGQLMRRLMK